MVSRLASWWRQSLARRPVLTNTAVYGTFYTAAELSQQTFNKIYSDEKPPVDVAAAARIVTVGSCLYAPTLYYWYKFLDKKFVGTSMKVVLTKVASDQLVATPVLLAAFYTYTILFLGSVEQWQHTCPSVVYDDDVLESSSILVASLFVGGFLKSYTKELAIHVLGILERKDDVFEELREKYWKTFIANQAFWVPGQTINFFFVPSNLRVVYVASASFIWINVLCFIKRQKITEKQEN